MKPRTLNWSLTTPTSLMNGSPIKALSRRMWSAKSFPKESISRRTASLALTPLGKMTRYRAGLCLRHCRMTRPQAWYTEARNANGPNWPKLAVKVAVPLPPSFRMKASDWWSSRKKKVEATASCWPLWMLDRMLLCRLDTSMILSVSAKSEQLSIRLSVIPTSLWTAPMWPRRFSMLCSWSQTIIPSGKVFAALPWRITRRQWSVSWTSSSMMTWLTTGRSSCPTWSNVHWWKSVTATSTKKSLVELTMMKNVNAYTMTRSLKASRMSKRKSF